MYIKVHVYSTLAKLVIEEEKKGNPDPIHHTQTIRTCKHKMYMYVTNEGHSMVTEICCKFLASVS